MRIESTLGSRSTRGESTAWTGETGGYRSCEDRGYRGFARLAGADESADWVPGREPVDADAALMRNLTVVQGARRMSSWSSPTISAPLRLRTPSTFSGTSPTLTSWPTGEAPPNSSLTSVW